VNGIIELIRKELPRREVSFVFPSEVVGDAWALRIGTFLGVRSLETGRFLSWDRFKEQAIARSFRDRKPVSALLRRLFAEALIARNREAPFFETLIPRAYADLGGVFTETVARILPSLAWYRERREESPGYPRDGADRDLDRLHREYGDFLRKHRLFEPSWEKASLRGGGEYLIFFPEAIEDFGEYQALLQPPEFRVFRVDDLGDANSEPSLLSSGLRVFPQAGEELRSALRDLRRFHEEGIPWEDMAISVPRLEDWEPCLCRDLELYHIPFSRRAGKNLGESGPGRLFSLIASCVGENFAFGPLKALLLQGRIPWKDRGINQALIEFGIAHNCVFPYTEGGVEVDIWDEAFRQAGVGELRAWYRRVRRFCTSLGRAKSFREISRGYFQDRDSLLDMTLLSKEENDLLARCIEELAALIQVEEEYQFHLESPFTFLVSHLARTNYVPDSRKPGVNIFPYRVAAAAPFACHIVLNCSQGSGTVLYRSLEFLRQDKREALGLGDEDASGAFFRLYALPPGEGFSPWTRFSVSTTSYSGPAIPHSFFVEHQEEAPETPEEDPFIRERHFWVPGGPFPERLFPVQRRGFFNWTRTLPGRGRGFSFAEGPVREDSPLHALLKERIFRQEQPSAPAVFGPGTPGEPGMEAPDPAAGEELTVTATRDLNPFFGCSLEWLFRRIFSLEEFSLEARLLDDTSLGILYHRILKRLFEEIAGRDGAFRAAHLEDYNRLAREICTEETARFPAFQGPLAGPLLRAQTAGIAGKIRNLLKTEARYFNGCRITGVEIPLEETLPEGGEERNGRIRLKGFIDRVSLSPEGDCLLIDYKTGGCPPRKQCIETEESPLEDFQIPLYISLLEKQSRRQVDGAFFFSIHQHDVSVIVGTLPGKRNKYSREEYQSTLDALGGYIQRFARAVQGLDFSLGEKPFGRCLDCDYRTICRSTYSLNKGSCGPPASNYQS